METEIIVALIGAGAVIIGAIIAAFSKNNKKKSTRETKANSAVVGDDNITVVGNGNTIAVEPKERKSILAFAAQNIDPNYILDITGIEKDWHDKGFSMVNVRILNKGNLDATVTKLKIKIKDYVINIEPHFYFSMYVKDGVLIVEVLNNGWGIAENYTFNISFFDDNDGNPIEITYVKKPQHLLTTVKSLNPGEKKILFKIKSEYFNGDLLQKNAQRKKATMRDTPFNHTLISQNAIDVSASVSYRKSNNTDASQSSHIIIDFNKFGFIAHILMRNDLFLWDIHPVQYSLGRPDTIYATIIDERTSDKEYNISRMIKSGEVDDFNIFIGSNKSCIFKIILSLIYNEGAEVKSSEITINIARYSNSKSYNNYIDGCEIAIENFRKKNQIKYIF
jgi:hypothetical protein